MKELKEALSFGIELGNSLGRSLADGQIDMMDVMHLWEPLSKAPEAFKGIQKIPDELKAMDDAATKSLQAYVIREFDIPQDKVEVALERAVGILLSLASYIEIFSD